MSKSQASKAALTASTQPVPDPPVARAAVPTPAIAGVTAPAGASTMTPVAPQQIRKPTPFLSEGMRHDLENLGYAIDPVSGARFDLDPKTNEVSMRERVPTGTPQAAASRWGKPVPVEVAITPQPVTNDTDKAEDLTVNPLVSEPDQTVTGEPAATGVTPPADPPSGA